MCTFRKPLKPNTKRNYRKPTSDTKEQATNEIALQSKEYIDSASQNTTTIDQIVVDETNIDSQIELAELDLTRVSNKPGLRRKGVPTSSLSPTGEKSYSTFAIDALNRKREVREAL